MPKPKSTAGTRFDVLRDQASHISTLNHRTMYSGILADALKVLTTLYAALYDDELASSREHFDRWRHTITQYPRAAIHPDIIEHTMPKPHATAAQRMQRASHDGRGSAHKKTTRARPAP